ncbi:MAG: hypothetical protein HYZ27_07300, partial [Deltaproteobacteria bacterium]|nr:hypothetical protein [Deltaproteobacteria bacterium]
MTLGPPTWQRWLFLWPLAACAGDEVTRLDLSSLDVEYLLLFRIDSAGELATPTVIDPAGGAPRLGIDEDNAQALVVALSGGLLDGLHRGRKPGVAPRVDLSPPPERGELDDAGESYLVAIPSDAPAFLLTEGAAAKSVAPPPDVSLRLEIDLEYCRGDRSFVPFGAAPLIADTDDFFDVTFLDVARIDADRVVVLGFGMVLPVRRGRAVQASDALVLGEGVLARAMVFDPSNQTLLLGGRDLLRQR